MELRDLTAIFPHQSSGAWHGLRRRGNTVLIEVPALKCEGPSEVKFRMMSACMRDAILCIHPITAFTIYHDMFLIVSSIMRYHLLVYTWGLNIAHICVCVVYFYRRSHEGRERGERR